MRSVITGVGSYLPEIVTTNDDLSKIVETSDEWIQERTGIRERRQSPPEQLTSDIGVLAAQEALRAAGKTAADVDLIVVATTTPDLTFPATAAIIQAKLGVRVCPAFDVQAVCSGFVYALGVADGFISRGLSKCGLVIGAEQMTRLLDFTDRGTCVLFGDGAGAFVLEPGPSTGSTEDKGIFAFSLSCDGTKTDLLYVDGGPSKTQTTGKLRMQGNQVFRHAVINIAKACEDVVAQAGLTIADVDWFVPHQANQRILKGVAERLKISESQVISTVAEHANTSAASIPLAFAHGVADGRIKRGDLVVVEAMGGGLTWGAVVFRF